MRHGGNPRFLDIVEQKLGGAKDVEPGELEVVPGRPSVGVGLEQVDLRGGDIQPDGLLLPVEALHAVAILDPESVLRLLLLPLADRLLPAIPRRPGVLGRLQQRAFQIELREHHIQLGLTQPRPQADVGDGQVVECPEDQAQGDAAVVVRRVLEGQAERKLADPEQAELVPLVLELRDPRADDHQSDLQPLPPGSLDGLFARAGEIRDQTEVNGVGKSQVEGECPFRLDRGRTHLGRDEQAALVHGDPESPLGDRGVLLDIRQQDPGPAHVNPRLTHLDVVCLLLSEPALEIADVITGQVGAGRRDREAIPDLFRFEVALGRQDRLGPPHQLLHQLLAPDPLLGDRQGGDLPGRVQREEDIKSIDAGIIEAGLACERRAAGDVGEDDACPWRARRSG